MVFLNTNEFFEDDPSIIKRYRINLKEYFDYLETKATFLYIACHENKPRIVKTLLVSGVNQYSGSITGETPLTAACKRGHIEVVRELLKIKDYVITEDELQEILNAIRSNKTDLAIILLRLDLNGFYKLLLKSYQFDAVVQCASEENNSNLVNLLQKTYRGVYSGTINPLLIACSRNYETLALDQLAANASNINEKDKQGRNSLYWACFNKNLCLVLKLLEHGAIITSAQRKEYALMCCQHDNAILLHAFLTPENMKSPSYLGELLLEAKKYNQQNIIAFLEQHNANPVIQDPINIAYQQQTTTHFFKAPTLYDVPDRYEPNAINYDWFYKNQFQTLHSESSTNDVLNEKSAIPNAENSAISSSQDYEPLPMIHSSPGRNSRGEINQDSSSLLNKEASEWTCCLM